MSGVLSTFWLLVIAHAITDYPLQGPFIAEYKVPGAPRFGGEVVWPCVLSAHALVNASGVLLVTASLTLSVAEAVLHWLIDLGKGRRAYGFSSDQSLHLANKAALAVAAGLGLG